ncbi:methylated-DNA--[protein]-cysteine S-methyltransferase [candidate division KSB1 bacterium]|nr:methylated-DNA--[protein]-cysteine S-methyltransferase [candidate division KSB1 bacterium]
MQTEQIVYKDLESPLGKLVIGATPKGCCLFEYQDRGGLVKIQRRITKQYKLEMARGTNAFLDQLELELDQYFQGLRQNFSVPLDVRGTPFQRAVWEQLLTIPYGKTRTYGEVARLVGKPRAVRAIGRANGDNPLAIVIPCHRVIQHDGKLKGYGGGLWRKEHLLTLESRQFPHRRCDSKKNCIDIRQISPEIIASLTNSGKP